MKVAFPPLAHRAPAPQQAAPMRRPNGEEPRTAGPAAMPYVSAPDKASVQHALAKGSTPETAAETLSFGDFIDMINPLQHIPLVGMIYRGLTGDEIGGAAQIIGGALYGGPVGAIAGTASAIIQHETGQSPAEVAISALSGENTPSRARAYTDLKAPVTKTYNFNKHA